MATGIGNLVANLTANTSGFTKGLNSARSSLSGFASFAASSMASFVGNVGAKAFTSLTSTLVNTGKSALALAADNEQLGISFTTMLGDAGEAQKLIGSLQKFGAETPFETKDINPAARSLLAFGISADQIVPTLRVLGDIAAGTNQPLGELAEIFGKAKVQGRLFQEDINQLTGRGIPVIQEFAKQFGVSTDEVRNLVEQGKIGFPQLQQALASLSGQGGQFAGLMQAQSQSLAGLWSTAKDNITLALTDIGKAIVTGFDLKGLLSDTMGFADVFRNEWLPSITASINTLGQSFQRLVQSLRDGWGKWIVDSLAAVGDFVSNFDLYWQMAQQSIVLWAANGINEVENFFSNVGVGLEWFGNNWSDVLKDIANLTLVAVTNMGRNFGEFFKGVKDWATGKGFNPDFSGLTEGFESSVKELPKFTKAAVADSTPELDALARELGERQRKAFMSATNEPTKPGEMPESAFQIDPSKAAASGVKTAAAPGNALKGTREALSNVFAAQRARNAALDPAVKVANEQLVEQKKTNQLMDKLIGQSVKTGEMVPLPL